jgi:hypothetical protein
MSASLLCVPLLLAPLRRLRFAEYLPIAQAEGIRYTKTGFPIGEPSAALEEDLLLLEMATPTSAVQ